MTLASKISLGCIADDYTGASDLANTLTRCGLRTVQTIGVPSDDLALPEVDAVVVSLKSRSIEAGLAVTQSRAAEKWMRGRGASHVLFKICSTFDSTDAGNIGPVMDALRADSGDAIVLVTPAFPETGRTVYQGNLFVGSVPLNESPLKDHPLNPMHDSNLVRVLARQSKTKIGLADLACIARGPDARPRASCRSRRQRVLARPLRMRFSRAISKPSARWRWIIASPSAPPGSGSGLRARWWPRGASNPMRRPPFPTRRSAGRRHASPAVVRRRRWGRSPKPEQAMPVLHLDADQVVAGKDEARRALAWAKERLGKRPGPDRQQFDAGPGCGPAGAPRPRCRRPCDRAGDGRHRRRTGRVRRAAAGGRRWRDLRRGGGSPGYSRLSGRRGDRRRGARCCARSAPRAARCCWR